MRLPSVPRDWALADLRRVPGLLSLSRLALTVAFPFVVGRPAWAIAVVLIAGASDVLDGWYARHFHQESATGAFVDALADKVFVLSIALTMVLTRLLSAGELVLLGVRELGEVVLAVRLSASGRHLLGRPPAIAGKITTICQYAAVLAILGRSGHRFAFILTAAVAGLFAGIAYWRRDSAAPAALSPPCRRAEGS